MIYFVYSSAGQCCVYMLRLNYKTLRVLLVCVMLTVKRVLPPLYQSSSSPLSVKEVNSTLLNEYIGRSIKKIIRCVFVKNGKDPENWFTNLASFLVAGGIEQIIINPILRFFLLIGATKFYILFCPKLSYCLNDASPN